MIRRLLYLLGIYNRPYTTTARLSNKELLDALAGIDAAHPVLQAVGEAIERGRIDAREAARAAVGDHAEVSYYLGAEWALENLADFLANSRAEAERRLREAERAEG